MVSGVRWCFCSWCGADKGIGLFCLLFLLTKTEPSPPWHFVGGTGGCGVLPNWSVNSVRCYFLHGWTPRYKIIVYLLFIYFYLLIVDSPTSIWKFYNKNAATKKIHTIYLMQKQVSNEWEGKKIIMKTSAWGKFEQISTKCSSQPPSSRGGKGESLQTAEFSLSHNRRHFRPGGTNVCLLLTT